MPPIDLDQPLSVDENGRPLTNDGYGRSYGLEVLLRARADRIIFWLGQLYVDEV